MFLICLATIQIFILCADGNVDDATKFRSSEQLTRKFLYNFTINGQDVREDQTRQLNLMSQTGFFTISDETTMLFEGWTRSMIRSMLPVIDVSPNFEQSVNAALDHKCPMYVDDEMRLTENNVIEYSRFGYIQHFPGEMNDDKHVMASSHLKIHLPHIDQKMAEFIRCSLDNRKRQFSPRHAIKIACVPPSNITVFDMTSFQVWMRARAVSVFSTMNDAQINNILRRSKELEHFLPPQYAPAEKCAVWPAWTQITEAAVTPLLGIALGHARSANFVPLTSSEIALIKIQVVEEGMSQPLQLSLNLTHSQLRQKINSWGTEKLIDDKFAQRLKDAVTSNTVVVRDQFIESPVEKTTVNYARIFSAYDHFTKTWHVGSVFYRFKTTKKFWVVENAPVCSPIATMCTDDRVLFDTRDVLTKNYVVFRAVNHLTNNA